MFPPGSGSERDYRSRRRARQSAGATHRCTSLDKAQAQLAPMRGEGAMRTRGAAGDGDQLGAAAPDRLHLERAQAVPPVAMRPPARRAALAAVHATDPAPAHRRLPTRAMVVLAARLAARRLAQFEALWCCRAATVAPGHGVPAWIRMKRARESATEHLEVHGRRRGPQGLRGKLQRGGHEPIITFLVQARKLRPAKKTPRRRGRGAAMSGLPVDYLSSNFTGTRAWIGSASLGTLTMKCSNCSPWVCLRSFTRTR
jgi:hypothetical protein